MRITSAEVATRWDTFLRRKALVMDCPLGVGIGPDFVVLRPLQEIVASLLYVDLVSLLEMGLSTRMSRTKFSELGDLKERIDFPAARGDIVDADALPQIRKRRNEIGHQVVQVAQAELNAAVPVVQRQFETWGVAGPAPAYKGLAEAGALRGPSEDKTLRRPSIHHARDYRIGVQLERRWVLAYETTEYIHGDGAQRLGRPPVVEGLQERRSRENTVGDGDARGTRSNRRRG